jgi:hypothetical protein
MKQTAVEWLVEEINKLTGLNILMDEPCVEQAKEMEKEQTKIYSIDKELFIRLPIEAVNCASFSVTHSQYFTTKMHLEKFKASYQMQCLDPNCDGINRKSNCIESNKPKLDKNGNLILKNNL